MNYKVASLASLAVMGLVAGSTAGPATASATHWRHNEPRFVQVQADEDSHGDLTISFVEKGLHHQRYRIYATGLASVDRHGDNGDGDGDHGGGGGWGNRASGGWDDQDSQRVRSEVLRGWARYFVDDEVTLMAPDFYDHGDGDGDHGGGGHGGYSPSGYDHTDEVTWRNVVLRDSATGARFKVHYIHHEDGGGDHGGGGGDHGGGGDGDHGGGGGDHGGGGGGDGDHGGGGGHGDGGGNGR